MFADFVCFCCFVCLRALLLGVVCVVWVFRIFSGLFDVCWSVCYGGFRVRTCDGCL